MAQDYEVARKLWDGKVPVQFVIDKLEHLQCNVKPYCVMVARMSYFTLILPRVFSYFGASIEQFDSENAWLQFNGMPLKWHYPIGVLFDLYKADDLLPWIITLKTKDFPSELLSCKGNSLESLYIQTIKEADQLKHKSNVVNSMKLDEQRKLWSSIMHGNFDDFWAVNKNFMRSSDHEPVLKVPIRIYRHQDKTFRQLRIQPYVDCHEQTVADALVAVNLLPEQCTVISHGIKLPLVTPLIWLLQNFTFADNFIHLIVR